MTKLLFVDDEPTIRLTLPKILEMHEFEVKAAATVTAALKFIQEEKFDVLLTDLNIGAPSDGFTVVSAMRRVQPDAVTIIITGYPAFESALQAIREQVDDYIAKPANVDELVRTIQQKVIKRERHVMRPQGPTSDSLETHKEQVLQRYVEAVRKARLPVSGLTDAEIADHVPKLIEQVIEDLRHPSTARVADRTEVSAEHGRARKRQGFAVADLVEEVRLLRYVIYTTIQASLLDLNASALVPDMVRIGDFLMIRLRESVAAYTDGEPERKALRRVPARKNAKLKPRERRAS